MDALTRSSPKDKLVLAGGGVVYRRAPSGLEVLLVHRPRYDDWSLPKGKLKRGEHPLLGALREIDEETCLTVYPGASLPTAEYPIAGALKRVFYWAMSPVDPTAAEPAHEIDRLAWLPTAEAIGTLTYDHDRPVVAALRDFGPSIIVVSANRRIEELSPIIAAYRPARLVSATSQRCRQALAPLGAQLTLPVEVDPSFDERSGPWIGAQRLRSLVAPTVVCAKASAVAAIVSHLTGRPSPERAGWILTFAGADLSLDPLEA